MREINYKLIVSDCDGTLLDSNNAVPSEVKLAIDEYVSSGGIFAVCTGRMLTSILPRVREIGLKGLVVAYQGTVIAEIESGKIIKIGGMKVNETVEVCRHLEELNQNINVYADEQMYTTLSKDNQGLKLYESIVGIESRHVDGKMSEFVKSKNLYCQKVSVLIEKEKRGALYDELKKRLGGRFDVTCSASVLVEVSPLGDDKGAALEFLCKNYKIPREKTVAVGDNLNDLPMIKAAGMGVAVGNAAADLKEQADFVTVSNNECAIAKVIEKFGYKQND